MSFDYKFITEPDDTLKCFICSKVANYPRQHSKCGRLFCRRCIEEYGMDKPCPICGIKHPLYLKDNWSKRVIRGLRVKCNNVERNCKWEGTVGTLGEHLGVCEFTLVPCTTMNTIKDDAETLMITGRHSTEKLPNRDYSCENRSLKGGTYATTLVHYNTCEKMIVTGTNEECAMRMECRKIKNHLANDCEHTVISCKYVSIGCDVKLERKDMRAHEQDDKAHLNKALGTVVKLNTSVITLEDTMIRLKDEVEAKIKSLEREERPKTFKVTQYQKKKDSNDLFVSPSFYTSPNGYHMAIKVYANGYGAGKGSHVSVYSRILKGRHDDHLNWPFIGTITFELLNQLEDENHFTRKIYITSQPEINAGYSLGYPQYISHSELSHRDLIRNTQYLKSDTLYFRISFTLPVSEYKPWLKCTTI